jgi:YVTN family beta-propeller protein
VPETTEVLTDATTQRLASVSPDGVVFTFTTMTPELAALDPGDVMVGGVSPATPYGFLRRVASVSTAAGEVFVETADAVIEDAIEQGELDVSEELSPAGLEDLTLPEGVTLTMLPGASRRFHFDIVNAVLYDHDGDKTTLDDQITANGALDLTLGYDFTFRVQGWRLRTMQFTTRADEIANLSIGADVNIASLSEEFPLTPPIPIAPITFPIGPVPVVITPYINIFVGIDGSVHVGVHAGVTQQAGMAAGLRYADGAWSPIHQFTNNFWYDLPRAYAALDARVYAGARLELMLYGVTGPYGDVRLNFSLHVEIGTRPWLDLYGGLEVWAGFRLQILSFRIANYSRRVIDFQIHLSRTSLSPPDTPTPTPTATATATPTATPTATLPPGLVSQPNGLAVNEDTHRVYVSSRDASRVYALNGASLAVLGYGGVGALPWGVAVNHTSGKLYVANFGSGTVSVLNAWSLAPITTIAVGVEPTFIRANPTLNKVFVVSHGFNALYVINGATDAVEAVVPTGGQGAWGLAYNGELHRLYVSHRDSRNVTTLDGYNGYRVISAQEILPCGSGAPYALDFNYVNRKLYTACAFGDNVNTAAIHLAGSSGLSPVASVAIGQGGPNGGGGVAVNTATGNVFFTNSLDDTVSVISGATNAVIATVLTGDDPFGAVVDSRTGAAYVGSRAGGNVSFVPDVFGRELRATPAFPLLQTPAP